MKFKHRAIVNEPFNLDIIANNLSDIAFLRKLTVLDRLNNVVYHVENVIPSSITCLNVYYISNIVINQTGNYYDVWEFIDGVERKIIKSQFTVRNGNIPNFSFIPYAYIYSISYIPQIQVIKMILKTNDPFLEINNIKLGGKDIICYHEIAPDIYYIKIDNQTEEILNVTVNANGYGNKEYNLTGSIRL
jgi:hypothetical protein